MYIIYYSATCFDFVNKSLSGNAKYLTLSHKTHITMLYVIILPQVFSIA